ncbi:hypothetical protein OPV22_022482 [Ensete ventricosum]|uniref:Uncharacterized protein n=1 Tax=Ensete ventricosum TaxID=4639 RepID=A0AAV8QLB7_ENSVE|nr:hypothetical protein OPV22_022482 [Ensete ventricosum]
MRENRRIRWCVWIFRVCSGNIASVV